MDYLFPLIGSKLASAARIASIRFRIDDLDRELEAVHMRTTASPTWYPKAVAVGRILVGVIFLWAGLEKFIGGAGAFTAKGFLAFGTGGTLGWPFVTGAVVEGTIFNPTHQFWVDLSKNDGLMNIVNFLVQFGQISIGLALILGIATRFASLMGSLMMLFFFFAAWDFAYGVVNQHLTYAVVTFGLGVIGAGNYYGLDAGLGGSLPAGIRRWFASGDTVAA
jgi:thiosulfate dehydrogenase [quinone] large subunit